MEKKENYECVIAVVDTGYSELVMNAAKESGAHGGTIVHGRGSASREMEDRYGIAITPDKELVFILVRNNERDAVMNAIYEAAGIETKAKGIVFSLPASHAIGLKFD